MASFRTLFSSSTAARSCLGKLTLSIARRTMATTVGKAEGDISAAFASLSGMQFKQLDPRFAQLKQDLIKGNEQAIVESWHRLLLSLQEEIPLIVEQKSAVIPEVDFARLSSCDNSFRDEVKKRGVAVIRNVIPESEALALKDDLKEYIRLNPDTKAFPPENPQVFELYWSPAQIKARSHPRMLEAQRFLMEFWHSKDPEALVSTAHPTVYADRLRMRLPGDAKFALGPHVDGGSCERWEPEGYGRGKVYEKIWQGRWEEYDPWESSSRLPVVSDLYKGIGACSMFRMFQGWLALSNTGPHEGTLLVNPLLSRATAYFLLRPFFSPSSSSQKDFLSPDNWQLDLSSSNSWLHGATPGHGQELRDELHPHLRLSESMVHVPRVHPGDYVAWHCDAIHAVDQVHQGHSDSSVMYIPTCPLTMQNAEFMARQRQAFLSGTPSPDFGGGKGESDHVGRPGVEQVEQAGATAGMQAFGLKPFDISGPHRQLLQGVNGILGF